MKTNILIPLLSILALTYSTGYAEPKIKKSHPHNGRTHTHVLPKEGLRHHHNKNKKAPANKTSSHTTKKCGNILRVLETSCQRTISKYEQGFMAGASRTLLELCRYPTNSTSKIKLQRFLTSSAWVVAAGSQYSNDDLRITMGSQTQSTVSYATGVEYAKRLGCTQSGKRLANNIVKYIDKTSSGSKDRPNWVAGCVSYYSGRYSKAQCQCIADFGRAVIPNIHQTRFSRFTLKKIIKDNPFVGMQVAMQCRIGNY